MGSQSGAVVNTEIERRLEQVAGFAGHRRPVYASGVTTFGAPPPERTNAARNLSGASPLLLT